MIAYVQSSLLVSPARTLVNTVNTVGVMGKGIAKVFRDAYPEMYEAYRRRCEAKEIEPGVLQLYRAPHKSILNFPTKRHWRQPSRLEDVEAGLRTFVESYVELGLTSVAFPQLGCGNGGLDWERQVRPLMERYLAPLPIDVYIHLPAANGKVWLPAGWDEAKLRGWLRAEPAPVSFQAFCADLAASAGYGPGATWRVASGEESSTPGLAWDAGGRSVLLPIEVLADLWRRLHAFGLLAADDLCPEHAPLAEALFALLAELPYLERVDWAMCGKERGPVASAGLLYLQPILPSLAPPPAAPPLL